MKLDTNVIVIFLTLVLVIVATQTLYKAYLIKKSVRENFVQEVTTPAPTDIEKSAIKQLQNTYQNEIGVLNRKIQSLETQVTNVDVNNAKIKSNIDTSLTDIRTTSDDFKQNINAFGNFHDTYSKDLQRILQEKLNYTDPAFESKQEIQNSRMRQIESDLSNIEILKTRVLEKTDNEIRSIICKSNSTKLNVEPVMSGNNYTGKFLIYLNSNCLSYIDTYGEPELKVASADFSDSSQIFELKVINNFSEYNDAIKRENTGDKKLVMKNDDIYYPFYMVHPEENYGKCVYIADDGHLSIKTVDSGPNGRFRTSQTVSFGSCPAPMA
jgi:predicted  nucleic acid-binding Zn-ribbon protein